MVAGAKISIKIAAKIIKRVINSGVVFPRRMDNPIAAFSKCAILSTPDKKNIEFKMDVLINKEVISLIFN